MACTCLGLSVFHQWTWMNLQCRWGGADLPADPICLQNGTMQCLTACLQHPLPACSHSISSRATQDWAAHHILNVLKFMQQPCKLQLALSWALLPSFTHTLASSTMSAGFWYADIQVLLILNESTICGRAIIHMRESNHNNQELYTVVLRNIFHPSIGVTAE